MAGQRHTAVRYPGGLRSLLGVVAFLVGYGLVLAVGEPRFGAVVRRTSVPGEHGPVSLATVGEPLLAAPDWFQTGLLFWNAHGVAARVPAADGPGGAYRNLLLSGGGEPSVLFVVPPALLVGVGLVATATRPSWALRYDIGTGPLRFALNGGLHALLGYIPFAFAGTLSLARVRVFPEPLAGVVLVGYVYPLVFGGFGGLLGRRIPADTPGPAARGWSPDVDR